MSIEPPPEASPQAIEPKLHPQEARLRAPRSSPARYSRKAAIILSSATAVAVAGAMVIPMLIKSRPAGDPVTSTPNGTSPSGTAVAVAAMTYAATPANSATDGSGVDCSQYPGMPTCAAKTAAAEATATAQPATSPSNSPTAAPTAISRASNTDPGQSATRSTNVFFQGQSSSAPLTAASPRAPATPPGPATLTSPLSPTLPIRDSVAPGEVMEQNGQREKAAFIKASSSSDYVEAKLEKPRSPYEIKAGTFIAAALLTAIDSDLPGEVVAQVTEPVFDFATGRYLLIPQGARIIGRYDAQVAYGQTRALVVWRRLIFPNGASLDFGAMPATDASGSAGLSDRVNDHFGQLAKGVVLSTLLSMGVASAEDARARSSGAMVLNAGASGVANEASTVGSHIASRDLGRQPTLQIRQGAKVRVLLDKDLILEPYN